MPALEVFHTRFHKFSTRPFAGDDLHIVCILFGLLRLVQFICLVPWLVYYLRNKLNGLDVWINDVPFWCPQYNELKETISTPILAEQIAAFSDVEDNLFLSQVSSFEDKDGPFIYGMIVAVVYFGINVTWLCMVWSAASIGTPTEPDGRDKYLRPLIIFQLIAGVCFPVILLWFGIDSIRYYREDNFRCGSDVPRPNVPPDEFVYFHFFSILMITYALEILFWPTIFINKIKHDLFQKRKRRYRDRIECIVGLLLRCLQCLTRGKVGGKDFKNRGELKDFADEFMELLNVDTNLDIVLSDIYVGMHMLARSQLEERERAIQLATEQVQSEINDSTEKSSKLRKKKSIFVLGQRENKCQVSERDFFDVLTRIKVPKIVAFHDIRTPCTGTIMERNAKVLRPQADVPKDTDFYKRLKKVKWQRAAANYTNLYLPGKIVHFLDPGDGRPHIPYYASRSEFDFIAISKTMASEDHSCIKLLDVLHDKGLLSSGEEQSIT